MVLKKMEEVKNKALVFVAFAAIFILISVSFASASIFTDLWGRFTGKVIGAPSVSGNSIQIFEKVLISSSK